MQVQLPKPICIRNVALLGGSHHGRHNDLLTFGWLRIMDDKKRENP